MQITRVKAIPISFPLPESSDVKLGIGKALKRDAIIIRLETSEGLVGYGESHPGRSPGAIISLVESTLAPLLIGSDPADCVGIWEQIYRLQLASHGVGSGAILPLSGIDMALWDIRGKIANMPLYKLLGGSKRKLPAYAGGISLGFQSPASLCEEASSYVEKGYKAVKLRIGDTVQRDCERIAAVRKALGDNIEIFVDANTAYSIADVRRIVPFLENVRVGWLEEPFACNDFASYREASRLVRTLPIAAGENHYTRFEFARLLEDNSLKIWQPDLSKSGGITECLRIAAMASAFSIPINAHSSATGLNHAATLHFLSAIANPGYFEACVSHFNPFRELFGATFEIDHDGCVQPPDGPGLGVEVDENVLREFPLIDGPGYVPDFDKI